MLFNVKNNTTGKTFQDVTEKELTRFVLEFAGGGWNENQTAKAIDLNRELLQLQHDDEKTIHGDGGLSYSVKLAEPAIEQAS